MKRSLHGLVSIALVLAVGSACTNQKKANKPVDYTIAGRAEKGPFDLGATITVAEIDSSFKPTGKVFTGSGNNKLGDYAVGATLMTPYADLTVNGYAFDEITGGEHLGPVTLRALASIEHGHANINVLTDLARLRTLYLLHQGQSFAAAERQARQEVVAIFRIPVVPQRPFSEIGLTDQDDDGAILVAASVTLLQMAVDRAQATGVFETAMAGLLQSIGQDLEGDGQLNDASIVAELFAAAIALGACWVDGYESERCRDEDIRSGLEWYYSSLGFPVVLAPFEGFLDGDGDGLLARYDYNLDFAPISTNVLGATVISETLPVHLYLTTEEQAIVANGVLVVNGAEMGAGPVSVHDGDLVAIKVVSATNFDAGNVTTTATITIGPNQGSFSLTTQYPGPPIVGSYTTTFPIAVAALSPSGNLMFVGGDNTATPEGDNFEILDLSSATAPVKVAGLALAHVPAKITPTHCNLVAIATDDYRLTVLDVANPAAPVEVTTLDGGEIAVTPDCKTAFT